MSNRRKQLTVVFAGRAKCRKTLVALWRFWVSACGMYRVEEAQNLYGLPTRFYAELWIGEGPLTGWRIISIHRKRGPAEEACKRHAGQRLPPSPKKARRTGTPELARGDRR